MLELRTVRVAFRNPFVTSFAGAALGLVAVLSLNSGCSGGTGGDDTPTPGPSTAEIGVQEYRFTPTEITAGPGQSFTVLLHNYGAEQHSISFEFPDGEVQLNQPVAAGTQGSLELTAPDDAGNYTFYCPIDDHFQKGEEGTLIVSPPVDGF